MHAQSMLVADQGPDSDGSRHPNNLKYTPGDTFGMCIDKFGVSWLVDIAGQQPT